MVLLEKSRVYGKMMGRSRWLYGLHAVILASTFGGCSSTSRNNVVKGEGGEAGHDSTGVDLGSGGNSDGSGTGGSGGDGGTDATGDNLTGSGGTTTSSSDTTGSGGTTTSSSDTTGSGGAATSSVSGATGSGGMMGMTGSGGATSSGGSGGGGTGGTTTTGGGTLGCGETPPVNGRYSIVVNDDDREYLLSIPGTYNPNTAYRLIFAWHPQGSSASNVAGTHYGLESLADGSAIFVAPEGISQGWANTDGRDIEFLQAMLDRLRSELCIDDDRIFSVGFSYGAMMTYTIGCAMGNVFRAIAPMSGALTSGCNDTGHPVAMWGSHGSQDTVVSLQSGRTARDVFLQNNGCDTTTTPTTPSPCVRYDGCDAANPVVWCEFSGDHQVPNNAGQSIWDFFSQF